MLERLKMGNFKSWSAVDLSLGAITGFFGSNSSGKTSLIQFLLMLKQTKDSVDRSLDLDFGGENSLANLGHFENVVHGHDLSKVISWELQWTLPEELVISDPEKGRQSELFRGNRLSIKTSVNEKRGAPSTSFLAYTFNNATFLLTEKQEKTTEFTLKCKSETLKFRFIRQPGRAWTLPGPIKSYAFPDQAKTYFQNSGFLSEFEHEYENFIDKIFYLGPLRDYPKRQYTWAGSKPSDVGRRGERVIDAILAAGAQKEKQNLKSRGKLLQLDAIIGFWLKELGLIHDFSIEEIAEGTNLYQTKVRKTKSSPETSIMDVGFGVSQVLPVIVLLHYVPDGSIVLLEQPEIHLHPAVQSGLADLIVHAATHRNVQVIVESHSEHLLRRLQRRVAEGNIPADQTKLYFCDYKNAASSLTPLELNMFGEIKNWPKDFFGDEFGEIAAIHKAGLERKMKQAK